MEDKIKNSEKYLDAIIDKNTGFSVPKNYFNELDLDLNTTLLEESIPKENVFSAPDSYFDSLEDSILNKVKSTKKQTQVFTLKQRLYKFIPAAIAASIALVISINYFSKSNSEVSFDNIEFKEIETWVLENSDEMTSQDIASFVYVDDTNDFEYADINTNDIEDYIIYNNTSLLNEMN